MVGPGLGGWRFPIQAGACMPALLAAGHARLCLPPPASPLPLPARPTSSPVYTPLCVALCRARPTITSMDDYEQDRDSLQRMLDDFRVGRLFFLSRGTGCLQDRAAAAYRVR